MPKPQETSSLWSSQQEQGALPDPVALEVLSFLPTRDLLSLQSVNKELNSFVTEHDELLFSNCLKKDFYEGTLLVESVSVAVATAVVPPKTPYKRMYLAFHNRWKLPRQDEKKSIKIPWRPPLKPTPRDSLTKTTVGEKIANKIVKDLGYYELEPDWKAAWDAKNSNTDAGSGNTNGKQSTAVITDDMNALVFIVRIGKCGNAVGLMEWKHHDCNKPNKLVFDRWLEDCHDWYDDFCLPDLEDALIDEIDAMRAMETDPGWHEKFLKIESKLCDLFCISLYAVDVQRFQVMSIVEDCPAGEIEGFSRDSYNIYNVDCANLFGVPPLGSPYYRPMERYKFECPYDMDPYQHPSVECLHLGSDLQIGQLLEGDMYFESIDFAFNMPCASIVTAHEVCNFYRALMKEKCADGGLPIVLSRTIDSPVLGPPEWTQNDLILDNIVSFLPFEEQFGNLRLVCHRFKKSVMNQIASKLRKTEYIGFERYEQGGWKKVQLYKGWSEKSSFGDSKDKVIDEAFKCSCKDGDEGVVKFRGSSRGNSDQTLDLDQARALLHEKGYVHLNSAFPNDQETSLWEINENCEQRIQVDFSEEESNNTSLFWGLSKKVSDVVEGKSEFDQCDNYRLYTPWQINHSYGITRRSIYTKRFLRSIFLVLDHDDDDNETESSHKTKKSRGRSQSTAKIITVIDSSSGRRVHNKWLFRFVTSTGKPFEILAEEKYDVYGH